MELSPELFPDNLPALDYQQLYLAVCHQIKKDFHPHSEMGEIPSQLSADWIRSELRRMLTDVIEKNSSTLGQILYRVDLSEKQVRGAMHISSIQEKLDQLLAMILKREAQKVWLRATLR